MAARYEGQIPTMEYKTLRYPGHAHIMEAVRDLGLLDLEPIDVKGTKIAPRDVAVAAMGPHLRKPAGRDLVALRVLVEGTKNGKPVTHTFELVDRHDESRGISSMERTTGYSLSITGLLQVEGAITCMGVHTPDECVPGERYVAELAKRGIVIRDTVS
jgi:lysine 6-dehydrogenase